MVQGEYHDRNHEVDNLVDHKPVVGVVGGNIVVIDPVTKLPVKDSGTSLSSILGGLIPQGLWDASTNTPTLADGVGTLGHFYLVSVAGTQDLGSGSQTFNVNDWVLYDQNDDWKRVDNSDPVHNDLLGIQGGISTERQHMTTAEHTIATRVFGGAALPGYVPDPVTESDKFLRDDGTYQTILQDAHGEVWEFDSATGDADPGNGKYRLDNATQSIATNIYISCFAKNGAELNVPLAALKPGDVVYLEQKSDPSRWHVFDLVNNAIVAAGYTKLPVNQLASGSDIQDGEECSVLLFFTEECVPAGVAFPGSPANGDLFNRTDLDMLFRYDTTRAKWLSEHSEMFSCGRGAVNPLVNVYCILSNATMSSTNGIRMPRNGTIVAVTVQNLNSVTRTIDYRVNNSTVNRVQLALATAAGGKVINANQDFSADDLIQVLALIAAGNAMSELIATIEVKWRA